MLLLCLSPLRAPRVWQGGKRFDLVVAGTGTAKFLAGSSSVAAHIVSVIADELATVPLLAALDARVTAMVEELSTLRRLDAHTHTRTHTHIDTHTVDELADSCTRSHT